MLAISSISHPLARVVILKHKQSHHNDMIFFTCLNKKKTFFDDQNNQRRKNVFAFGVKNDIAREIAPSLVSVHCVGPDDFRQIKIVFSPDLRAVTSIKIHSSALRDDKQSKIMTLTNQKNKPNSTISRWNV